MLNWASIEKIVWETQELVQSYNTAVSRIVSDADATCKPQKDFQIRKEIYFPIFPNIMYAQTDRYGVRSMLTNQRLLNACSNPVVLVHVCQGEHSEFVICSQVYVFRFTTVMQSTYPTKMPNFIHTTLSSPCIKLTGKPHFIFIEAVQSCIRNRCLDHQYGKYQFVIRKCQLYFTRICERNKMSTPVCNKVQIQIQTVLGWKLFQICLPHFSVMMTGRAINKWVSSTCIIAH